LIIAEILISGTILSDEFLFSQLKNIKTRILSIYEKSG